MDTRVYTRIKTARIVNPMHVYILMISSEECIGVGRQSNTFLSAPKTQIWNDGW